VEEFYRRLEAASEIPSTCQPSPADFVRVYEEVASRVIPSFHSPEQQNERYVPIGCVGQQYDRSRNRSAGVDSRSASLGIGVTALVAAKAVLAGEDVDGVLAAVQRVSR